MVWSVSEKDFAGKSLAVRVFWRWWGFSDNDMVDQKALEDGEGDRNETRSLKGFFLPRLWYHVKKEKKENP